MDAAGHAPVRDLFVVDDGDNDGDATVFQVRVVADHPILSGHFPGRPIVPGAALVQLVQQLCSRVHERTLRITNARHIKFLAPIDPRSSPRFAITIRSREADAGAVEVEAEALLPVTSGPAVIALRMKAAFNA